MDVIETLKSLGKAALSISNLQERAAILELVNKAQTDVFELRQQTLEMQARVAELKRQLVAQQREEQLLDGLKHERNVYWKDGIPYCVACVHKLKQRIPLSRAGEKSVNGYCPHCKMKYVNVYGDNPPRSRPHVTNPGRPIRRNY